MKTVERYPALAAQCLMKVESSIAERIEKGMTYVKSRDILDVPKEVQSIVVNKLTELGYSVKKKAGGDWDLEHHFISWDVTVAPKSKWWTR